MVNITRTSINDAKSRYTQGGDTEEFKNRLGWWERNLSSLKRDDTDVEVTIATKYHRRPDLFAYDTFGNSLLGWFILQYNSIVDINEEFIAGKKITVPTTTRMHFDLIGRSIGGITPSELS